MNLLNGKKADSYTYHPHTLTSTYGTWEFMELNGGTWSLAPNWTERTFQTNWWLGNWTVLNWCQIILNFEREDLVSSRTLPALSAMFHIMRCSALECTRPEASILSMMNVLVWCYDYFCWMLNLNWCTANADLCKRSYGQLYCLKYGKYGLKKILQSICLVERTHKMVRFECL